MIRHVLYPAVRAIARGLGRTRRIEQALAAMQIQLTRMETTMDETKSALLGKLADLKTKVDAYTTDQGERIAKVVAAARAAQKADDQVTAKAEMDAALAEIDEISKGLVQFSPSAN